MRSRDRPAPVLVAPHPTGRQFIRRTAERVGHTQGQTRVRGHQTGILHHRWRGRSHRGSHTLSASYELMKLSTWARPAGAHPRTAYRWCHTGAVPVPARKRRTGTTLAEPPSPSAGGVAAYARVSPAGQRADVDRQVVGVVEHATAVGLALLRVVAEVDSAACGNRPTLRRLLADPDVATVVVEHRDRLARFGVEYVEAAMPVMQRSGSGLELAAGGRQLVVRDDGEVGDDVVRDMVGVGTSMCARLCGRRSARRRAERAGQAAGEVSA